MSSMPKPRPPFDLDTYEYERGGYYPAFKAAVDEKICAAKISETLAGALRNEGLVYNNTPVKVADIGCGPADSIQMYLAGARHTPGFEIHATDYSTDYTGNGGLAQRNLTAAKAAGKVKINGFSVTNGDAFNGNLLTTMQAESRSFDLAYISHMLYHANPQNVGQLIGDVATKLLKNDGVAIALHVENIPDTFQHFRAKYGRKSDLQGSDTPAMEVTNPPQAIEQAAQAAQIPIHTAHFENNYRFAPMDEKYWEMFKHPEQYHRITDPNALANLKQLYFVTQRAANEFAADTGPTGLSAYVDEVRRVIAPDQQEFERDGGNLPLAETVQLIGSSHANANTQEKIARVMHALEAELLRLTQESYTEWRRSKVVGI